MKKIFSTTVLSILIAFFALGYPANCFSQEAQPIQKAESYTANIPVEVTRQIEVPRSYHEGLYIEGGNIWLLNGEGANGWVIDIENGSMVSEIEPAGTFAEGITPSGDGAYWYTDWDAGKIYRVKVQDGKMMPEREISVDDAHPAGVAWTGEKLFVITWTRGITGTKFHLLEFDKDGKLQSRMEIKNILEPAHMAWDGEYLWITSWYSQLVYKVDPKDHSILGHFRSPAPKSTGIAWDGQHFWITGTYADLYQVKVGD